MKKPARITILVLLFSVSFYFISHCNFVCAATINVPGDYATIQAAVDAASDGDTIQVAAGSYTESVAIDTDDAANLTIQGAGASSTTVTGGGNPFTFLIKKNGTKIDGFTIQMSSVSPHDSLLSLNGGNLNNITLSNNTIEGVGSGVENGVEMDDSFLYSNITISSNTISNISRRGLRLYAQNSTVDSNTVTAGTGALSGIMINAVSGNGGHTISNNIVSDFTAQFGIMVANGNDNTTIYGNRITNCGWGVTTDGSNMSIYNNLVYDIVGDGIGIAVSGEDDNADSCSIINNTVSNVGGSNELGILVTGDPLSVTNITLLNNIVVNSGVGIGLDGTVTGSTVNYNCVYNNTTNYSGLSAGANDINKDPVFVNAGANNYNIQSTSPCIDAGTSSNAPSTDIAGTARPQGPGYDIGAYEYALSSTLAAGPNQPGNATVANDDRSVVMMQLRINGEARFNTTLTSVTFTGSGTGDEKDDLSGVELFNDANGNGKLDTGESKVGSTQTYTADDGTVTFSSLSEPIPSGGNTDFLVVYNFNGNASSGDTFGISAANNSDVTITGSTVAVTGAPVSGRTVTTGGSSTTISGTVYDTSTNGAVETPITSLYVSGTATASGSTTSNPYSFSIAQGQQVYLVVEKEGYTFPSNEVDSVVTGDHGDIFTATGSSVGINIPVDPGYPIELIKTANKKNAVIGDVITYNIRLRNKSTRALSNIAVVDEIVNGFKYVSGSSYIGSTKISDPVINSPAVFTIGAINGSQTLNMSYQVRVSTGMVEGRYKAEAVARDTSRNWQMSNANSHTVEIISDPLFNKGTIIGKVFLDLNSDGVQDSIKVSGHQSVTDQETSDEIRDTNQEFPVCV